MGLYSVMMNRKDCLKIALKQKNEQYIEPALSYWLLYIRHFALKIYFETALFSFRKLFPDKLVAADGAESHYDSTQVERAPSASVFRGFARQAGPAEWRELPGHRDH